MIHLMVKEWKKWPTACGSPHPQPEMKAEKKIRAVAEVVGGASRARGSGSGRKRDSIGLSFRLHSPHDSRAGLPHSAPRPETRPSASTLRTQDTQGATGRAQRGEGGGALRRRWCRCRRHAILAESNTMAAEQASPPKRRRGGRSCALCSSRCGHAATRMLGLCTS